MSLTKVLWKFEGWFFSFPAPLGSTFAQPQYL